MPSTVIRRFKYRPECRELEVLFTTGRRYLFSEVPEEAAQRFKSAYSKGAFFNRHIRDRYPFRELPDRFTELSSRSHQSAAPRV